MNGADSGEDSNGEDDEYLFESEDERQARNLRRKRSQSSAWAIFVKYYVMTVCPIFILNTDCVVVLGNLLSVLLTEWKSIQRYTGSKAVPEFCA